MGRLTEPSGNNTNIKLYKRTNLSSNNKNEYRNYSIRNSALYYYRVTHINYMKEGKHENIEDEPDLDMLTSCDLKLYQNMKVDIIGNKFVPWVDHRGPYIINKDLDEIVHLQLVKAVE